MTRLIVTLLCKEPTLFFMGTIRYIVELSNYFLSSNNYNYISTYMRMPLVVFTINAEIHFASYSFTQYRLLQILNSKVIYISLLIYSQSHDINKQHSRVILNNQ